MSLLAPVANLMLILEDDDLFAPVLTQDGSHHLGAGNIGRAYGNVLAIGYQENIIKLDSAVLPRLQALYFENLAGNNFVLFATGLNYSVNLISPNSRSQIAILPVRR